MPSSQISHASDVEALIRRACRRRLLVLVVEQLALALALVFGGGVLMLLVGTQILDWYWLGLLGAAGAAVAWFRLRGRRLPPYRVAQIIDRRLHLSDSISTAWFLLASQPQDDAIARLQIQRAEQAAQAVDPGRAFPFTGQRAWALTAALGVVVFGLFGLRYLITRSLSLERALVSIHLGTAFERLENAFSRENQGQQRAALGEQPLQTQLAGGQQEDGRSDMLRDQGTKAGQQQDGAGASQPQAQNPDSPSQAKPQDGQSQTEGNSANAQQNAKDEGERAAASDQATSERPNDKQEQSANGQEASSGLVDKMKDALSSLLAKMHPNPGTQKSTQNGERTPDNQQGSDQNSAAQNQQGQQQEARSQQSNQQHSSEAQAQGQTTERAQASQGRNTDQSPQQGSDAHSGIGRQDGDKELKEADQLRAMGKLAEIIGKRSANLTGEMMIETPSGKQQLKTAYSQRLGHHADLGGEINRDEIPLADQQYIREYMELVRKQGKNP